MTNEASGGFCWPSHFERNNENYSILWGASMQRTKAVLQVEPTEELLCISSWAPSGNLYGDWSEDLPFLWCPSVLDWGAGAWAGVSVCMCSAKSVQSSRNPRIEFASELLYPYCLKNKCYVTEGCGSVIATKLRYFFPWHFFPELYKSQQLYLHFILRESEKTLTHLWIQISQESVLLILTGTNRGYSCHSSP